MGEKYEIAFSFDTTGSMYSCLEEVRSQLRDMVQELNRKIPNLRVAIFAHGDYCDAGRTYVTKFINFTSDSYSLCNFVKTVGATGGGDAPECYELVMREVQEKLSWTPKSQKSLVLIGDANPHTKDEEQNYRHLDWKEETTRLRDEGIKIYSVHCNPRSHAEEFYQHIAARTYGYYIQLDNIKEVKDVLMNICFREAGLESSLVATTSVLAVPDLDEDDELDSSSEDDDSDIRLCCLRCKERKPPNEFPEKAISDKCEHYPGVCLRCIVKFVANTKACPQEGCNVKIDDEQSIMQWKIFEATLERLFLDYNKVYEENRKALLASKGSVITVTSVTGDTCWVDFNSNMTIPDLKQTITRELGIDELKQKLLYKEQYLKTYKQPGQPFRLSDYNIQSNDSLNLIVPLYTIPENLDHVVFDLSWEFPPHSADFLDASCLVFEKTEFVQVVDWNHSKSQTKYYLKGAVKHTAKNEKTKDGRLGHQQIHVKLKSLPSNITHLYFTLSSWKAPTLESFRNPRLQFYDAYSPNANLCSTTFTHALKSQAVIMCSVVRDGSRWQIFECDAGGCVNGNTKLYNPLRERIVKLIADDLQ